MSDAAAEGFRGLEGVSPVDSSNRFSVPFPRARRRRGSQEFSMGTSGETTSLIFSPRLRVAAVIPRPDRIFRLRGTFVVQMAELDDGTVVFSHRDLPVQGYGPTDAEALSAFEEAFEVQWENLVERPVDELTPYARSLREDFLAVVQEVLPR